MCAEPWSRPNLPLQAEVPPASYPGPSFQWKEQRWQPAAVSPSVSGTAAAAAAAGASAGAWLHSPRCRGPGFCSRRPVRRWGGFRVTWSAAHSCQGGSRPCVLLRRCKWREEQRGQAAVPGAALHGPLRHGVGSSQVAPSAWRGRLLGFRGLQGRILLAAAVSGLFNRWFKILSLCVS